MAVALATIITVMQQPIGEEMGKKKAKRLPKPILEKQSRKKKKVAKVQKSDKPTKNHKK